MRTLLSLSLAMLGALALGGAATAADDSAAATLYERVDFVGACVDDAAGRLGTLEDLALGRGEPDGRIHGALRFRTQIETDRFEPARWNGFDQRLDIDLHFTERIAPGVRMHLNLGTDRIGSTDVIGTRRARGPHWRLGLRHAYVAAELTDDDAAEDCP